MSVPGKYISTLLTVKLRYILGLCFTNPGEETWRSPQKYALTPRDVWNKLFSSLYLTLYICYYFFLSILVLHHHLYPRFMLWTDNSLKSMQRFLIALLPLVASCNK